MEDAPIVEGHALALGQLVLREHLREVGQALEGGQPLVQLPRALGPAVKPGVGLVGAALLVAVAYAVYPAVVLGKRKK